MHARARGAAARRATGHGPAVERLRPRGVRPVAVRRPARPAAGDRRERLRRDGRREGRDDHRLSRRRARRSTTATGRRSRRASTRSSSPPTRPTPRQNATRDRHVSASTGSASTTSRRSTLLRKKRHAVRRARPAPRARRRAGRGRHAQRSRSSPASTSTRTRPASTRPGHRGEPGRLRRRRRQRSGRARVASTELLCGHATAPRPSRSASGQQLPLADDDRRRSRSEGTGVRLTIDQDLQFLAQRRLAQAVQRVGRRLRHRHRHGRQDRADPRDRRLPDLRPQPLRAVAKSRYRGTRRS